MVVVLRTVKLDGSTGTSTETSCFIFTQQNWNTPQEFLLVYGNPSPDPANVKIVFSVTSTADTAYNDLIYYFSGNLTALELPNYSVHVHNAQKPRTRDTDATHYRRKYLYYSWRDLGLVVLQLVVVLLQKKIPVRQLAGLGIVVLLLAPLQKKIPVLQAGGTWDSGTCTVDDNRDIKSLVHR